MYDSPKPLLVPMLTSGSLDSVFLSESSSIASARATIMYNEFEYHTIKNYCYISVKPVSQVWVKAVRTLKNVKKVVLYKVCNVEEQFH